MAGQTINDRLLAARHSLAGQGLAKSVCKATTEEMIGPKKKHLDYLVQCTNEPNVSIPQLANLLVERSQNTNWIVVYKALITVHHMMCYGNERFTQYLASSNSTFQLSNFLDKSGLQGSVGARTGYDMSPFIRRYARYLNEKALSYRTVAFDFCKVKRGKEDGTLRTMNAEKLLKTLPTLQNQLDALLEFDCTANNLTNGVINMSFMLLFRDLIRLFACYNDGVINLLEKYFDMNKKQCREALDLYKKFLIRMDRVAEFLKVAENVGIDKGDIPDLTKAPSSLLDALEQHLASIEGKKSNTTTPTQSASNQRNVRSGVTALSSTSSAFGTIATNGRLDSTTTNGIDESLKQQILAEEEAAMNQYKSKIHSPTNSTNPFLSTPLPGATVINATPQPAAVDLFGVAPTPAPLKHDATRASDDLLQLNNPFADMFAQPSVQTAPVAAVPQMQPNMWMANGNGFASQPVQVQQVQQITSATFVSESNFSSVFGTTESTAAQDVTVIGDPALFNPFLTDIHSATNIPSATNITAAQCGDTPSLLLDAESEISSPAPIIDLFATTQDESSNLDSVLPPIQSPRLPENSTPDAEIKEAQKLDKITSEMKIIDDKTVKKSAPPPRPPPPRKQSLSHAEPSEQMTSSPPVMTSHSPSQPGKCTTLADLNQEIMMALGSPGRVAQGPPPSMASMLQQENIPAGVGNSGSVSVPAEMTISPAVGFVMGAGNVGTVPINSLPIASVTPMVNPAVVNPTAISPTIPGQMPPIQMCSDAMQFAGFDGLGGVLQPQSQTGANVTTNGKGVQQSQSQSSAILTGDLESSLASLAENLSINNRPATVKGVQWNSPKNGAKPSSGWTPQPMAATTGAGYRPMGQGMPTIPTQPIYPQMQPMGIRPMQAGPGIMAPMPAMATPTPATNPPMAQQQSLLFH